MAEEEEMTAAITQSGGAEPEAVTNTPSIEKKPWHESISQDLQRTASTALRSARSVEFNPSSQLRTFQDLLPQLKSQYQAYENAFFNKVKDEIMVAREHPAAVGGVAITSALLLLRGPRRFLFRNTLGRFQSEEAQYVRAEKNIKELSLSVDLMKKESKKLLERVALAEKEVQHGHNELRNTGIQIQRLARSTHKVETQAADLMDVLRETPGRESLKLRAEVVSIASVLKQQRTAHDKRIMKISDLGIAV